MLLCCTWKDERMGEEEGKEKNTGCSTETGCKHHALHYFTYFECRLLSVSICSWGVCAGSVRLHMELEPCFLSGLMLPSCLGAVFTLRPGSCHPGWSNIFCLWTGCYVNSITKNTIWCDKCQITRFYKAQLEVMVLPTKLKNTLGSGHFPDATSVSLKGSNSSTFSKSISYLSFVGDCSVFTVEGLSKLAKCGIRIFLLKKREYSN